MPLDEMIKIAEKMKAEKIKSSKNDTTNKPPKKTLFNSRQFER